MSIYKRGESYYFDFWEGGQRYAGRIGPVSKSVAKDIEDKIRVDVIKGEHIPQKNQAPVFEKWTPEFITIKSNDPSVKPRTVTRYQNAIDNLIPFFKGRMLSEITPFLVRKYMKERLELEGKEAVTKATVNREVATLRHCLNVAVAKGVLASNPMTSKGERVKLLKENNQRVRFLTEDEEKKLLENCNDWIKPLVLTALHTGGRASELLNLVWNAVNFNKGTITFKACYSKTDETRTIPMSKTLTEVLKQVKVSVKVSQYPPSDYVFCSREGTPYKSYRTAFETACRKAKIEDFHFHDLRHTFASRLIMRGVDLVTVKELLGHKNITMTLRYSHLSEEHKKKAVSVLDQAPVVKIDQKVPSNFPSGGKEAVQGIAISN